MKKTSYKDKTQKDLLKALTERRESLRQIRFGSTGSKARNVKGAGHTRKDIARILTELNSSTIRQAHGKQARYK